MSGEQNTNESAPTGDVTVDAVETLHEAAAEHAERPEGDYSREGDRDVFERILKDRNQADPRDTGEEGDDGEKPESPTASADDTEQGKEETPAKPQIDEQVLRALRRAKTPQSVIDSLNPEEAKAWAEQLHELQSGADTAFSELERLKKEMEEAESEVGTSDIEDSDESGTNFDDVTLDEEDVTPFLSPLGLDGDEEITAAVLAAMNSTARAVAKVMSANQPKQQEDPRIAQMQGALESIALRMAREDLGKRFPRIQESDEDFGAVVDKYRTLIKTGDYDSHETAMVDAATLILGPQETPKAKKEESSRPRKSDQPSVKTKRVIEPATDDPDRAVFDWLRRNPGDVRGAKRAAGLL